MKNDEGEAESVIKLGGSWGSSLHGKNEEKFMTHLKFYLTNGSIIYDS